MSKRGFRMRLAGFASVMIFLLFAAAGLALAALIHGFVPALAMFLLMGLIGALAANRLFNRFATAEEKRLELEDRVRNSYL